VSGVAAELACRNSGKRLCRPDEWIMACRGERGQKFPYGASYEAGRCNVHRESHPAQLLHGNASINHLDPRLNLVRADGQPLLRPTGTSPECGSRWGNDTIYDMVGNLDEWVDDPDGLFVGGFYARNTREGCDARVSSHPREYYDYSLGVRCCR
jgi:formylglycine-generating enzyme required for sulfatase activity